MKDKRRNHSAQFKAKVALAAAKGDKTTAVAGDSLRRTGQRVWCSSKPDRSMEKTIIAITA